MGLDNHNNKTLFLYCAFLALKAQDGRQEASDRQDSNPKLPTPTQDGEGYAQQEDHDSPQEGQEEVAGPQDAAQRHGRMVTPETPYGSPVLRGPHEAQKQHGHHRCAQEEVERLEIPVTDGGRDRGSQIRGMMMFG